MAQKTKIGKNYTPTNANPGYIIPMAITHQQIELESCLNPLKMRKVLLFAIKKIVSVLDFGIFVYVYMMGVCLCISGLHSDDIIIPWEPTKRANFVAQNFIEF